MKLKVHIVNMIEVSNWNKLVVATYGRPYDFQQQEGCKSRGTFDIIVPTEEFYDNEMHDEIPEIINGDIMGVKFAKWLKRNPEQEIPGKEIFTDLFWERNFYPDIHTLANDLHIKGLLDAGTYTINIDW